MAWGEKQKTRVHAGILESGADLVAKLDTWIQWGAQSHDWRGENEAKLISHVWLHKAYRKHGWKFTEWPHPSQKRHLMGLIFWGGFCSFPVFNMILVKRETSTAVILTNWQSQITCYCFFFSGMMGMEEKKESHEHSKYKTKAPF